MPVCDLVEARAALDDDDETLQMLIGIVLDELPKQAARIAQALADQDAPTVASVAHRLKGSLANFRAWPLCELLLEIEQSAHAENLEHARSLLERVDPLMVQCLNELRIYHQAADESAS